MDGSMPAPGTRRTAAAAPCRIAFVIWSLDLGGAEQVVLRLAAALDRGRFAPVIFCLNEPGRFAHQAEAAGIEVVALHKRGAIDLPMLRRLAAALRERRIEVVHTHLWGANVWGRIAGRMAGVPRVVCTEHNVDAWKRWHHFAIDRVLAGTSDVLIAVSGQVRQFYEERRVARGRWTVVYNGIEAAERPRRRVEAFAAWGIPEGAPVVGLVGRLVEAKAPHVFLDAIALVAAAVPEVRALVIGDGPLRQQAEEHARRVGVAGRTTFAGLRQDVPDLLPGLDAMCFSSTREGLSIAMLEAMAAGVPVVATRVGGNPELIDSDATGFLVPVGDTAALAERLTRVLRDRALAEGIRHAARERVRQRFSLDAMVRAHEALYLGEGP